jgi:hypothetical protein
MWVRCLCLVAVTGESVAARYKMGTWLLILIQCVGSCVFFVTPFEYALERKFCITGLAVLNEACAGAVGRDIALQAGRMRVRFRIGSLS